jgi:hypothetical protein
MSANARFRQSTLVTCADLRKGIGALLSLHDRIDPFETGTEHEQNPRARAAFLAAGPCQTKLVFGGAAVPRRFRHPARQLLAKVP